MIESSVFLHEEHDMVNLLQTSADWADSEKQRQSGAQSEGHDDGGGQEYDLVLMSPPALQTQPFKTSTPQNRQASCLKFEAASENFNSKVGGGNGIVLPSTGTGMK